MNEEDHETMMDELLRASQMSYAEEKPEEKPVKKLGFPVRPMGMPNSVPSDWLGNRTKNHDPDADQCHCYHCYLNEYPFLSIGDPVQCHPQYPLDSPAMQAVVGIYDRRLQRIKVECSVCKADIELEGEIATTFDPKASNITHTRCLCDEVRAALEQVGYEMPFLISKKVEEPDAVGAEDPAAVHDD